MLNHGGKESSVSHMIPRESFACLVGVLSLFFSVPPCLRGENCFSVCAEKRPTAAPTSIPAPPMGTPANYAASK
jgi:hypothetical protein